MARSLSPEKRFAILAAATEVVAAQGVSAPTAKIAKEAGLAEGTLFTYFATKDVLLEQLYLDLKRELAGAMLTGYGRQASLPERWRHLWDGYVTWGLMHPLKRKAMLQLTVSDRVGEACRTLGNQAFEEVFAVFHESLAAGILRDPSLEFSGAIMESLAEVAIAFGLQAPEQQDHYRRVGFEAFWHAVAKG